MQPLKQTHTLTRIFWQTSLQSDSRTHQQIDGSQCVIGCEKRRGQLIHPIISFAVAIETDAYGNTAKRRTKGGERKKRCHEILWGRCVYLYLYCTNVCVCVQETERDGGGGGGSSSFTTLMFNSVCMHILNECDRRWWAVDPSSRLGRRGRGVSRRSGRRTAAVGDGGVIPGTRSRSLG